MMHQGSILTQLPWIDCTCACDIDVTDNEEMVEEGMIWKFSCCLNPQFELKTVCTQHWPLSFWYSVAIVKV